MTPIEKTIHQTWKTADVPAEFRAWRDSWIRLNPDFEYRLWTDEQLDALTRESFPDLYPIFRNYKHAICRADLGRYLVLKKFGGIYVDLDFECLRPIGPLVNEAEFLIGLEPDTHLGLKMARLARLDQILCPSFIACTRDHPFWDQVLEHIKAAASEYDVLDATGPFLLTRAWQDYPGKDRITLAQPSQLYPFDKQECEEGRFLDIERWEEATRNAFGVHYWRGSWWVENAPNWTGLHEHSPVRVISGTTPASRRNHPGQSVPRISCVLVPRREEQTRRAVRAFASQTHPNRELIIIDSSHSPFLADIAREFEGADVRLLSVPPDESTGLRIVRAFEGASGSYVCLWNEDALHDPQRLELQLAAIAGSGAQAALIANPMIWAPADQQLVVAARLSLDATLLCERQLICELVAAEEGHLTSLIAALTGKARLAAIDLPRLFVLISSPDSRLNFERTNPLWSRARTRFEGERYVAVLNELGKRLPAEDHYAPAIARTGAVNGGRIAPGSVLVLTPVRDAEPFLPRYFELLERLECESGKVSVAFLEGDSRDRSLGLLKEWARSAADRFHRVEVLHRSFGFHHEEPRWTPSIQRARREAIARARNHLLFHALRDEEWVLWLDADLVDYPPDLLGRLIGSGESLVVPLCVRPDGRLFDLNSFRIDPALHGNEDRRYLKDGLYQPPAGVGRIYLDSLKQERLAPLDAVGGTALLVRAELHRRGLMFPPFSYRGYIETEGLAMMARDMGVIPYGLPNLRITHADR